MSDFKDSLDYILRLVTSTTWAYMFIIIGIDVGVDKNGKTRYAEAIKDYVRFLESIFCQPQHQRDYLRNEWLRNWVKMLSLDPHNMNINHIDIPTSEEIEVIRDIVYKTSTILKTEISKTQHFDMVKYYAIAMSNGFELNLPDYENLQDEIIKAKLCMK